MDDVLGSKKAAGPTKATSEDSVKQENDAEESPKDISGDAETREKEEREREQREQEEREKEAVRRAARAKAEEEMRLQEVRDKQVRKEAKLRERQAGHAIVEAKATAAHPTEKFTRACLSSRGSSRGFIFIVGMLILMCLCVCSFDRRRG